MRIVAPLEGEKISFMIDGREVIKTVSEFLYNPESEMYYMTFQGDPPIITRYHGN